MALNLRTPTNFKPDAPKCGLALRPVTDTSPSSFRTQCGHATEHIEALHVEKVQDVDEYPVFCQLFAIAAVDINHSHIGRCQAVGRQAHITACGRDGQVWPPEKAAVVSFGQFGDMTIELAVL